MEEKEIIENYKHEMEGYLLYSRLGMKLKGENRKILSAIAKNELRHVKFWEKIAKEHGLKLPKVEENFTIKEGLFYLGKLFFGEEFIMSWVSREEKEHIKLYKELRAEKEIRKDIGLILGKIREEEKLHNEIIASRERESEKVKDSVYAMSDGIIEVLSTVSGLTGVFTNNIYVLFGGIIVGLSGTVSMTVSDFFSSSSKSAIERRKEKEVQESVKITALSYVVGAIIPLLPFIFNLGIMSLIISYLISGLAAFLVGYIIGFISDTDPFRRGATMGILVVLVAFVIHIIGNGIRTI